MGRQRNTFALISLCLLASTAALFSARESLLTGRTTTSSGQFVIYSKDAARRSLIAKRAEASRATWNAKLSADENWTHPIIIQDLIGSAKPRGNPGVQTAIFEGDGGALKVQISIYDPLVLRGQALDAEIYKALGLEWIYRNHPLKAGKSFRLPPAWLVEALTEEVRIRDNDTPSGVYAALLRSEQPPKIEDFLRAKPELMEATTLTLYRTQANALLKTLLGQPEGGRGLGAFLSSLAEEDADMKTLLAAFPSLGGESSRLGKLWTLAIARDSTSKGAEPLSVGETDRALQAVLELSMPADPKKPERGNVSGAAALPEMAKSEGGPYLMRQKAAELLALEFRAHPLLKPVIAEYRNIASTLSQKPKKNVEKAIEENGKIHDLLLQRTGKVDDYMNWFEATQLDTLSEEFLEVTNPPSSERRSDPISRHLDAVEVRGW